MSGLRLIYHCESGEKLWLRDDGAWIAEPGGEHGQKHFPVRSFTVEQDGRTTRLLLLHLDTSHGMTWEEAVGA